jgi:hypothetical protein
MTVLSRKSGRHPQDRGTRGNEVVSPVAPFALLGYDPDAAALYIGASYAEAGAAGDPLFSWTELTAVGDLDPAGQDLVAQIMAGILPDADPSLDAPVRFR